MIFGEYQVGQVYNRRRDIHGRFGGQQQGGISTPGNFPVIFAFTGASGSAHGYADGWTVDGTYRYFGEGQTGNMVWKGGNTAIRDHCAAGEDILLFETLDHGLVRFMGEFVCAGYQIERAPDRLGIERDALVFNLMPLSEADAESVVSPAEAQSGLDLSRLRHLAIEASSSAPQAPSLEARRTCYERSKAVRLYVPARAQAQCEACGGKAPFFTPQGTPYLEPHHIRRLSDGGPDDPRFMAAVCPNCHREIHYGVDGAKVNERLQGTVSQKEANLENSQDVSE
jgi:5-methylcytosine-specific restriction protein A